VEDNRQRSDTVPLQHFEHTRCAEALVVCTEQPHLMWVVVVVVVVVVVMVVVVE
jgi:hypothetical protein